MAPKWRKWDVKLPVGFGIVSGPASISGNTLTVTGAGTVEVEASQAGNANYNPAPAIDQSFTVTPAVLPVTANDASDVDQMFRLPHPLWQGRQTLQNDQPHGVLFEFALADHVEDVTRFGAMKTQTCHDCGPAPRP